MAKKSKVASSGSSAFAAGLIPLTGLPCPTCALPAPGPFHGVALTPQGQLKEIKLNGQEGVLLAELERRMPEWPVEDLVVDGGRESDVAGCFARAVHERLGEALVACEERFPLGAGRRVIYVVVESRAARRRKILRALADEYFPVVDSESEARLEIVDQQTDEALQSLIDAGLLASTVARARKLWPPDPGGRRRLKLTAPEARAAAAHRAQAARKLKMAAILAEGGLREEARAAALEAVEPLGRMLAVENRLREPVCLEEALMPPLNRAWKGALPVVREFLRKTTQPVLPLIAALRQI